MKTGNSKASKPHFLILNITIIIDLKYLLQHGMKNLKFELPNGSYSISDIQDYFEYILKKHEENIDNPFIKTYVNEIKNRITFKIKTRYYLKLLTPERMKLIGSTENKMTKKNTVVVLVHCSIVKNDYQQDSWALYIFVPNKLFGSLLEISPKYHNFLKTFSSEFQKIKVWFTDEDSQLLETEGKVDLHLLIE